MSRSMRGLAVAAFITVIAAAHPSLVCETAAAQTAEPAPSTDPRARAQSLMDTGNAALAQGDYVQALESFRAAYALFPSPKLLLNIGTTSRLLGRNVEAASAYATYLVDPGRDPTRVADVQRLLAEIDASLAIVHLIVRTPDATVRVDGRGLGFAPIDIQVRLEPGEHTLSAEKRGLRTGVATLRLGPSDRPFVDVEPAQPPVVERVVRVGSGDGQRVAGFLVGSAGLAAVAAGAITGVFAIVRNNEASGHCDAANPTACDLDGVDLGDAAKSLGTASTLLLSIGSGAIAAGIVVVGTAPRDKASQPRGTLTGQPRLRGAAWSVGVSW